MGCYAFDDGEHRLLTQQARAEGVSVRQLIRKASAAYDAHLAAHQPEHRPDPHDYEEA